jgi:hypothetical protein
VLFLALDQGSDFAAAAALGALAGVIAEVTFCLAYGRVAHQSRWPLALIVATGSFAVIGAALQVLTLHLVSLGLAGIVALAAALRFLPKGSDAARSVAPPRWDIPARMVVTTVLVLVITGAAQMLGPRLSGLLATFPIYAATLTVFAHHHDGPGPAVQVLRGLLLGLFAFTGFFLTLGAMITGTGIALAFAAAVAVALAIQAASLKLVLAAPRTLQPR